METLKVDAYGIYKFCTSFKRLLLVNSEDIITGIVKVRLVWR